MELETGDKLRLMHAAEELRDAAKTLKGGNSNTNTVRFDVGGAAIWLSLTCCLVTVVLVIVGGFFYVDQMRRVDKMQDYLNAIYLQAPSLRPKGHVDEKAP